MLAVVAIGALVSGGIEIGFQAYDIYKQSGDVLDLGNYNGSQIGISVVEGGIMALIPIGVTNSLGRGALQIATGVGAETLREIEKNPNPKGEDFGMETFSGIVNVGISVGIGNIFSGHPYIKSLDNSIRYVKAAVTPMGGGKYVSEVPIMYLRKELGKKVLKQASIDQLVGILATIISSQTLQNIDAIKTYFENRIQSELLALLQNTEENFMYNKE